MVEALATVCRAAGSTVADRLGYAGPRAIIIDCLVAKVLAERRDAALTAVPTFFPVSIVE